MAIQIPNYANIALLTRALSQGGGSSLSLHLYTNVISLTGINTSSDTSGGPFALSNFTEASYTGYSAIALANASWVITPNFTTTPNVANGAFSGSAPTFTVSTTGTLQNIQGYYVTDVQSSANVLLWFEPFSSPKAMQYAGDNIIIVPNFTGV